MNKVEVGIYQDKCVTLSLVLQGAFGQPSYKVFQVRTDNGVAIFTDESDAREFANVKLLDEALDRIKRGEQP